MLYRGEDMEKLKVCVAGATGWIGKELVSKLAESDKFTLVGAISRQNKGKRLGEIAGCPMLDLIVSGCLEDAFQIRSDVLVDFTSPEIVKEHVIKAVAHGIHVVVGTSGLTNEDYEEIHAKAIANEVGVIAAGNYAITAIMLQRLALLAAKELPYWEIIDYAAAGKPDAPSGTARELAHKLSEIRTPTIEHPIANTIGIKEARGASLGGSQIHSLRIPSYTLSCEVIFGLPEERLIIRHDAGNNPLPYVRGVLLAISKVFSVKGLVRGIDSLL
jgi:4-hydroxy-tetrahydrodipicolinate reductase